MKLKHTFLPFTLLCVLIACLSSCDKNDIEYEDEYEYKYLIKDLIGCMNMKRPADSYDYPIYPGMPEWRYFISHAQMVEACEVPIEILKTQSTQAVIQALWEYPFFMTGVMGANSYQQGFDRTFPDTNAYQELILREDAGTCLLERLIRVKAVSEEAIFHARTLEIFISQEVFLSKLTDQQKKEVVKAALEKYNARLKRPDLISSSEDITLLLIGRILLSARYAPFIQLVEQDEYIKFYLTTSNFSLLAISESNYDVFGTILSLSKEYIK